MKIDLSGRTAIVSGSTSGIDFAIARGLADSSVANGRTQIAADRAVAAVKAAVPAARVRGIAADLGTAAGSGTLEQADERNGGLVPWASRSGLT